MLHGGRPYVSAVNISGSRSCHHTWDQAFWDGRTLPAPISRCIRVLLTVRVKVARTTRPTFPSTNLATAMHCPRAGDITNDEELVGSRLVVSARHVSILAHDCLLRTIRSSLGETYKRHVADHADRHNGEHPAVADREYLCRYRDPPQQHRRKCVFHDSRAS